MTCLIFRLQWVEKKTGAGANGMERTTDELLGLKGRKDTPNAPRVIYLYYATTGGHARPLQSTHTRPLHAKTGRECEKPMRIGVTQGAALAPFGGMLWCYVMLCYVMLCYVMLCYVMLCYVMLCYVML
ncbi:hypothetical protein AVEN_58216-1 [Araneus ventricosus]|uniref:Uncharacterized protein n=1 Tax=Araneus ventricosus TaxID=182803 RepID=A0A4Y2UH63_ARAVE|nr:hypothetical protein AVEN_58216-1 [Araneus ventricosus]